MQVTTETPDPCTLVLNVTVDEDRVKAAFDESYKEFSKYANVPGFRPGKAPRSLVARYVNRERVRSYTQEQLIRETLPEAAGEQDVTPFRSPEVEPGDLEDGKPYLYKAVIPLEPQVTLGDYTGLEVEKPVFPITDALVEQRLDALRSESAKVERVTDRPAQPGDMLIAEMQVVDEGDEDPAPARRRLLQIAAEGQPSANAPGFDEAVTGLAIGETRTFELTYPDDYEEEARRGKKATYTVTLSSISAKQMPELTDAFAKQVADVETVDALRARVRERMELEAERLSDQLAEQRLIEKIVAASEIHFPAVLVREEGQAELEQLGRRLQQARVGYGQYLSQIGKTSEEHQAEVLSNAEARVRSILALRQVAIQEGLQADEAAIDAGFNDLLKQGVLAEDQIEEYRADPARRFQVANALVQQRLHDFLFANNTLNEVPQTDAPDPEALAEAGEEEGE